MFDPIVQEMIELEESLESMTDLMEDGFYSENESGESGSILESLMLDEDDVPNVAMENFIDDIKAKMKKWNAAIDEARDSFVLALTVGIKHMKKKYERYKKMSDKSLQNPKKMMAVTKYAYTYADLVASHAVISKMVDDTAQFAKTLLSQDFTKIDSSEKVEAIFAKILAVKDKIADAGTKIADTEAYKTKTTLAGPITFVDTTKIKTTTIKQYLADVDKVVAFFENNPADIAEKIYNTQIDIIDMISDNIKKTEAYIKQLKGEKTDKNAIKTAKYSKKVVLFCRSQAYSLVSMLKWLQSKYRRIIFSVSISYRAAMTIALDGVTIFNS